MRPNDFQDQADGLRRLLHAAPPEVLAVLPCGAGSMNWVTDQLRARAAAGSRLLALEERQSSGNLADCLGISPRFDLATAVQGELPLDSCLCEAMPGLDVALAVGLANTLGSDRIFNQRCVAQLRAMRSLWDEWLILARGGTIEGFSQLSLAAPRFLVVLSSDPMSLTAAYACLKRIAVCGGERHVSVCLVGKQNEQGHEMLQRLCDVVLQRLDMPLVVVDSLGAALAFGARENGVSADAFIERLVQTAGGVRGSGVRVRAKG